LIDTLLKNKVDISGAEPSSNSFWAHALISWFPILLLLGIWIYFMRQMQGGGSGRGALSFGKSRARLLGEDQVRITFADVAGVEEAKEEVSELVEFLRDPAKFQKLGGKIPSGVLMVGSPGTGKTLLAKAIAGEAKVPFFTISGSDFVEMFVGVGASRVRDMFEQAKKHAPCIIFIDEIDAVGRHRGAGLGGGHDEREQTLNQLLVEMDGFEGNEGVIVIAATNRPDVLDPALLRPGRFDRQVVVPLPDIRGREQILKVHMRKVAISDNVKPNIIARGTPGFSGADLANLVNEAALFAARANKKLVDMDDFERAKDKVMMGAERRSMVMSEQEKKLTAYHESGHAVVGRSVPGHDPVYKVTIIPRGRALGVTMFLPEEDRLSFSKLYLESQLCSLFGGRIAEELVFGKEAVTTGASNDIQRATDIARKMVTKWGMSERLGPLTYSEEEGEIFLGHSVTKHKDVSDETARIIDEEIRKIVDSNYAKAERILNESRNKLDLMAEALLKYETLDSDQIDSIMNGRVPPPPTGWDDDDKDVTGHKAKTVTETEKHSTDQKPPVSGPRPA
jgi:cell division protease FtsH